MDGRRIWLRCFQEALVRVLTLPRCSNSASDESRDDYDDLDPPEELPADVNVGHFVVHAIDEGEPKRFVVELDYLAHPGFMKLLKLAEEEYGFDQAGVLTIPFRSKEILEILENRDWVAGKSI